MRRSFARRFRAKLFRGGLIEKPDDAAIGRANARGGIGAQFVVGLGADGVENFALVLPCSQEKCVAALIENYEREGDAIWRLGGCDDGQDPARVFEQRGDSGNSEAVWPSGPMPSRVTSKAGGFSLPKIFPEFRIVGSGRSLWAWVNLSARDGHSQAGIGTWSRAEFRGSFDSC